MSENRAEIDPLAWQLARERVGLELRKYYDTSEEFPAGLIDLLRELERVSRLVIVDRLSSPGISKDEA